MKWTSEITAAHQRIQPYIRRTPALAGIDLGLSLPVERQVRTFATHWQFQGAWGV